jgi:hypothetical protein
VGKRGGVGQGETGGDAPSRRRYDGAERLAQDGDVLVEGGSDGHRQPWGVVLRQGVVAREAVGGASERKRHVGAGTEKSGGGTLLKGAVGRRQMEGGGGPAVRTPHSAERACWPRLVGGAPTMSRLRGSVSGRCAPGVADVQAPVGSGRGREERGTGDAWVGLKEKGMYRAQRNIDVVVLFKSICFD